MELGEKLRQARLEAGLSQRQLCGEDITRNMLSQIEHGSAKPSMKTLQVLASRLGKTVSYFLEEDAVVSPNQHLILEARQQFDDRDYSAALEILSQYRGPDTVFDREKALLWVPCCLLWMRNCSFGPRRRCGPEMPVRQPICWKQWTAGTAPAGTSSGETAT